MAYCVQVKHSDFFNYPTKGEAIPAWEVPSGNPCGGTKTAKTIYFNTENNKFYADVNLITLLNGYYFMSLDNGVPYTIFQDGNILNTYACPINFTIYKADMGTPSDMSRYGNSLLCAYADKHVVVKYDVSTGTNPIGTIVAGQLNVAALGAMNDNKLNTPMLVQWRDDGQRFVVYSGGLVKSLKIFSSTGTYLSEGSNHNDDPHWRYIMSQSGHYNQVNDPTNSLIGLLTANDAELSSLWLPVGLKYVSKTNGGAYDSIFMSIWNKGLDNKNNYRVYCIVPMTYVAIQGQSLTGKVADMAALRDGDVDIIRDFTVIRKAAETNSVSGAKSYSVRLAIVTPRSWSVANTNRFKHYELQELDIWITDEPNAWALSGGYQRTPRIQPKLILYKGYHRINGDNNGQWQYNVKAEICFCNGTLLVAVKNSSTSVFEWMRRNAALIGSEVALGVAATFLYFATVETIATTFVGNFLVTMFVNFGSMFGVTLGISGLGLLILVVGVALFFLLKKPKTRAVGTNRMVVTFSGSSTVYTLESGSVEANGWIENDLRHYRTLLMDSNLAGSSTEVWSLKDKVIKKGNWNSSTATGTVM